MFLNADLSDDQVLLRPRFLGKGPSQVAAAFHGKPLKTKLVADTLLFRFSTLPDDYVFRGAWWLSHEVFLWLLEQANGDRKALIKLARMHLAVKFGWSSGMRHIYVIQLTQPVFAWVGPARAQQETAAHLKDIRWPGQAQQIYLPNLMSSDHHFSSDHARLVETYKVMVEYDPREDPSPLET
ncbi:MAG: hypothetical protein JNK48_15080 [Bryobacterales bacterium]|nr:hypothetical protein [Bryobacterales bacterium]